MGKNSKNENKKKNWVKIIKRVENKKIGSKNEK